ncbi:MAG: tetratricopeptide repeat protein [Ignavibacteriales bacterium]|nr:tetratricopeptide repeat protein [Ignavibacteriales bacterium]
MNTLGKIIFIFCFILILLHVWGAGNPSYMKWGFQSFAYYDITTSAIVLLIALTFFIPSVLRFWIRVFERVSTLFSSLPSLVIFLCCVTLLIFLSFQFPARGLLLGDSKLILLTTSELPSNPLESANFRNQPLVLGSLHGMKSVLAFIGIDGLQNIYILTDILAGIIFLGIVYLFLSKEKISNTEKLLSGLFLFAGGGVQFFFGYIENYALLYAFTAGYVITALFMLQKRISIIFPVLFFLGIVGLHLGAMIYLPSVIVLLILSWQNNKRTSIVLTLLLPALFLLLIYLSDYGVDRLIIRIQEAFKYDFLPFSQPANGIPYTLFSLTHFVEWINLNFLVVPLGLIPAIIILTANYKQIWQGNKELLFLLPATICGLIFTFIMTPALGMFRDWDLMASFFIPLIILSWFLFINYFNGNIRKQVITIVTIISILHIAARVGINSNPDKHVSSVEIMAQPALLSPFAQQLYYDRLANIFWERKDYAKAKQWYERYTIIDSSNPRIIANLSDVYRKLNENENVYRMLKRSVELGNRDPKVSVNLSVELFRHDKIDEAIALAETTITLYPDYAVGHANLGLMYLQTRKMDDAINHIETALKLGKSDPKLLRALGEAYEEKGNNGKAFSIYTKYLSLIPNDTAISNKLINFSTLKKNFTNQK